jgi:hypothetical protein
VSRDEALLHAADIVAATPLHHSISGGAVDKMLG